MAAAAASARPRGARHGRAEQPRPRPRPRPRATAAAGAARAHAAAGGGGGRRRAGRDAVGVGTAAPAAEGDGVTLPEEAGGRAWLPARPVGDKLDAEVLKLWVPAVLNFLIIPLVGAVDVLWVGRMGEASTLAAQGAANQVFTSTFWIISFLPSLVTPLVAKAAASGDDEAVRKQVGEAVFVSVFIGALGMAAMIGLPNVMLGLVGLVPGSEVSSHAEPYIMTRALSFIPALVSTVAFAAFRGTMDTLTPLKVTLAAQVLNVVLDPIFIFGAGFIKAMGLAGAALATAFAEVTSCAAYITIMLKRGLVNVQSMVRPPSWASLQPLLTGGFAVQMRSVAINCTFLAVTSATLAMDASGQAAAAHTISTQLWQLGGVVLLALSSCASILVPQRMHRLEDGGPLAAREVADRLLVWGLYAGVAFGLVQLAALPLLGVFTPIASVQEAARVPSILGAVLQSINGMVFVGEGIMQGHQAFEQLAINTAVASGLLLISLHFFGDTLSGVWFSFYIFNFVRLAGAMRHHLFDGPLAGVRREASLPAAASA